MPRRILCLETDWGINNSSRRLVDTASVRPLFDFISNYSYLDLKVTYRIVSTVEELQFLFSQMRKAQNDDFDIIYFAFHGSKGNIQLFETKAVNTMSRDVSLEELASLAQDCFCGKKVLFGSCSTLKAAESRVRSFMEKTGATFVSGYQKTVDYVLSSILDLALINELEDPHHRTTKQIIERMEKLYGGAMQSQKMKIF